MESDGTFYRLNLDSSSWRSRSSLSSTERSKAALFALYSSITLLTGCASSSAAAAVTLLLLLFFWSSSFFAAASFVVWSCWFVVSDDDWLLETLLSVCYWCCWWWFANFCSYWWCYIEFFLSTTNFLAAFVKPLMPKLSVFAVVPVRPPVDST